MTKTDKTMDFETTCMMFSMREPYYGIILSSMLREPSKLTPTMGVTRSGNVFKLLYNPDFVKDLTTDETLELLKHEVLHLAFNHFTMFDTPPHSAEEQKLRNIAADLEVNSYIDTHRLVHLSPLVASKFGWTPCEGTLTYYARLKQQQRELEQQQQNAQQPDKPCNGGKGGDGQPKPDDPNSQTDAGNNPQQSEGQNQNEQGEQNGQGGSPTQEQSTGQTGQNGQGGGGGQSSQGNQPQQTMTDWIYEQTQIDDIMDDHSQWPDDEGEAEKEQVKQIVDDLLVFAANETEKSRGVIPGELQGKIELIRNRKRPKPVADWKRFLRRYLGYEFTETIKKSKKRESRRFPDAAGNRHRKKSKILVAIDTSGSVSMPEYNEFFGQITTLTASANFTVIECDSRIQHQYEYTGKPNQTLHGGGGTSFQPVVDMYNEHRKDYDALVYFTDGEASIPKDTPKDTLWVISSLGNHDKKRYQINGATAVFIPQKTA